MDRAIIIDGKFTAEIKDNTYIRHVRPSNFFRLYNGFGISKRIVNDLKRDGVQWLTWHYDNGEGKILYRIPLAEFLIHAIPHMYKPGDTHLVCPIDYMKSYEVV
jgi:hypothetical protein